MNRDRVTLIMQVFVSLVLLAAGLAILAGAYEDTTQKAAIGWIGLVVGYWLR